MKASGAGGEFGVSVTSWSSPVGLWPELQTTPRIYWVWVPQFWVVN